MPESKEPVFIGDSRIGGAIPRVLAGKGLASFLGGLVPVVAPKSESPHVSPGSDALITANADVDDIELSMFDRPPEEKTGWIPIGTGPQHDWKWVPILFDIWLPVESKDEFGEYVKSLHLDKDKLEGEENKRTTGEKEIRRSFPRDADPPTVYSLEGEIVWRMLRSRRFQSFDTLAAFKQHVRIRLKIVEVAEGDKGFDIDSKKRRPPGWGQRTVTVDDGLKSAIDEWWKSAPPRTAEEIDAGVPVCWTCGCLRGAELVCLRGMSQTVGTDTFDDFGRSTKVPRVGTISFLKAFKLYMYDKGDDDLIPGDMVHIRSVGITKLVKDNPKKDWGARNPRSFVGENVICLGDDRCAVDDQFAKKSRLWGLGGGTKSLKEWQDVVAAWSKSFEDELVGYPTGAEVGWLKWTPAPTIPVAK